MSEYSKLRNTCKTYKHEEFFFSYSLRSFDRRIQYFHTHARVYAYTSTHTTHTHTHMHIRMHARFMF